MNREKAIEELMALTSRMIRAPKNCQPPGPARGEEASLVMLQMHGGKAMPGELAKESGVTTARVAAILKQLESKGYITRETNPTDRRQVQVVLTESGRQAAQREVDYMSRKWDEVLDFLGEEDTTMFLHLLGRFADYVEIQSGKCDR